MGTGPLCHKWQVRAQIEAAETVEAVRAIEIDYSQAATCYAAMLASMQGTTTAETSGAEPEVVDLTEEVTTETAE